MNLIKNNKMSLSKEDLKLLNDFENNYKKTLKDKKITFSEETKNLLKKVKEKQNILNFHNTNSKDYNFILHKDTTLGIDRNSDKKLSSGKYKIDYKLDLHGETLDSAYNKVRLLFEKAELNNYRCLLIITGKGLHSQSKTIKSSIIDWFKEPYFSNKIIKYTDAHIKDGGSGALYVLLRNNNKL